MSLAEYRERREVQRVKARTLADVKREVADSGLTPEELAEIQPRLKRECLERMARRAA